MRTTLTILALAFFSGGIFAQVTLGRQVIGTAGSNVSTGVFKVSSTIGQMEFNTAYGPNIIITEGFQQTEDLSTSIKEELSFDEIQIYPNPVRDAFTIDLSAIPNKAGLQMELYTSQGALVNTQRLDQQDQYVVRTEGLASGTYMLRVRDDAGRAGSWRIVKVD